MEQDDVLHAFVQDRVRLTAIARRMLGSAADADDAVQDVWLRLAAADHAAIDNIGGWLTTVTGRVCVDRLRARWRRPTVPAQASDEHVANRHDTTTVDDPAEVALVAEAVGAALQAVVGQLAPAERVAPTAAPRRGWACC